MEKKKFLAIINANKKHYCKECEAKITKEYDSDYWKPCSMEEGFENRLYAIKNRISLKNQLKQIKDSEE